MGGGGRGAITTALESEQNHRCVDPGGRLSGRERVWEGIEPPPLSGPALRAGISRALEFITQEKCHAVGGVGCPSHTFLQLTLLCTPGPGLPERPRGQERVGVL